MSDLTYGDIAQAHPMPWKSGVKPRANRTELTEVVVVDAAGQVVPLFTIMRFTELVTQTLAARPTPTTPVNEVAEDVRTS